MCGAIGVTDEIGDKVDNEVQRLFSTSTGEIACVGSDNTVSVSPGSNVIHCAITAKIEGKYTIIFKGIKSNSVALDGVNLDSWVRSDSRVTEQRITPGDDTGVKTVRLVIPENAPEGDFIVQIEARGPDNNILKGQQQLDFKVSRTGAVRNVLC